jgi:hypothetical protein
MSGFPLALARLAWILLVLSPVGLVIYTFPEYYRSLLSLDSLNVMTLPWSDSQDLVEALADLELTSNHLAIYRITLDVIQLLSFITLGMLVFWKKSNTWLGLFASYVLIGLGLAIGGGLEIVEKMPSPWAELFIFTGTLMWPALFIFFFLFPDGQFIPRWTRLVIPLWAIFFLFWAVTDLILKLDRNVFQTWGNLFLVISMGTALTSQVYRYLKVSGGVERLQTKWFLFALAVVLVWDVSQNFFLVPFLNSTGLPGSQILLADLTWQGLALMANLSVPLAIGIALFRYRLWDIDVIIRRTLIYGTPTASLALLYAGSVVILQQVFRTLTGTANQSQLAIVVSTLAVAALFNPLRRRVQERIDRRFYRQKYDAERILMTFAETARQQTDLDALNRQLVEAVQSSLQPEQVSLWLKGGGKERAM